MGNPPVTGRRIANCNCGRLVHWEDLLLTRDVFLQPISQNRLLYSRYNSAFWTCDTASDAGKISEGPFLHEYEITYDSDNNASEGGGSQTWTGAGVFRTTAATDCSSASTIVIAADIGPYQRSESPLLSVSFGVCDENYTVRQTLGSWSFNTQTKVWGKLTMTALSGSLNASTAFFYFAVTPQSGQKWYVDRIQLEFDKDIYGHYVQTNGTALVYTTPTRLHRVVRTCPECRRSLYKSVDTHTIVELPTGPIPVSIESEVV